MYLVEKKLGHNTSLATFDHVAKFQSNGNFEYKDRKRNNESKFVAPTTLKGSPSTTSRSPNGPTNKNPHSILPLRRAFKVQRYFCC